MAIQTNLPRSTPESQNVSPQAILDFVHALEEEELNIHSLMLIRNGQVISEGTWSPYQADDPHILNSVSKSFTSTAIGMAVEEGILSLDDTVISFFPDEVTEEIEKNMAHLKIRHLLSMSTGHDIDTTGHIVKSDNWVKEFLNIPIIHEPGTFFLYNTGATYMLSAILTKATGIKLLDFLEPRLFNPLGMTDITTTTCPKGIHFGGAGMKVKIEDIAKFGLLYLQKGVWEGKRILSENWIEEATSSQIPSGDNVNPDWVQGYGYQFWRCRHGAYRADGAFGQYSVVLPKQNAVLAVTAGTMEQHIILDLLWEHLIPGMSNQNVQPDNGELENKLATLSYDPPVIHKTSPIMSEWSGKQFEVETNDVGISHFSFHFSDRETSFEFSDSEEAHKIQIGTGEWKENKFRLNGASVKGAVSGTWHSSKKYVITLHLLGTPFFDTWTFDFISGAARLMTVRNIWLIPGLSDVALMPNITGQIKIK